MRYVNMILILAVCVSITGTVRVAAELPESKDMPVTDSLGEGTEAPAESVPAVQADATQDPNSPAADAMRASNPLDESKQSAVWIDTSTQPTTPIVVGMSTDGGINWINQSLALPVNVTSVELHSVRIDLLGRTHILLTGTGASERDAGIYIYSTDKDCKTFRRPIRLFANNSNGVASEPVCAVNVIPQHYLRNHIYVAWVVRGRQYSEVLFTKSLNGGYTFWTVPMRLDVANQNNVSNPGIAIGPFGEITVSWDIDPGSTGHQSRFGRTSYDGVNFYGLQAQ